MKKQNPSAFILCIVKISLVVLFSIAAVDFGLTSPGPYVSDGHCAYATTLQPSDGYTLFAPMQSNVTYLIDNGGEVLHTWESEYKPGLAAYLLENGSLLRTGRGVDNPTFPGGFGAGGIVQKIDWNGTVVWEFEYSTDQHLLHHDIEQLPNGNVLMIAWEYKTAEQAIEAGRRPESLSQGALWADSIIEVEPDGATGSSIVWEWHVWDHLIQDFNSSKENYGVVADFPGLMDINFVRDRISPDVTHINSIDYNEERDQILLSVKLTNEIWVIDHSTTTEEAAGHTGGNSGKGGDILYRWGNPQAYRAGTVSDQRLFAQHDATWVKSGGPREGDILVFNNGRNRPDGAYSSVDEIVPPFDGNSSYSLTPGQAYGPDEQIWTYTAETVTDLYSDGISGAQRLPNGNTLVCSGEDGWFFEVTEEKEIVWEYLNSFPNARNNNVFKIRRYGRDFPGLLDLIRPHDVAISNVTIDKASMMQGEEPSIISTVENQGSFTETFNVTVFANTTQIGKEAVSNLGNGTDRVLNFTWNTSAFAGGNYTISVLADVVTSETDISDNVYTYGGLILLSHDLAITNSTIFKTSVGRGYSTYVNVSIRNQGDYEETFNTALNVTTTTIGLFTNMTLISKGYASVRFEWNTTGYAKGNYSLKAYVSPVDGEIDTEDNTFSLWILVTIAGDVDGNRKVNIFDIVMIAGSYGTVTGDPGYIPNCDIDGSGAVNIFDVVRAAGNYGQNW
jgi:hypothetical protein